MRPQTFKKTLSTACLGMLFTANIFAQQSSNIQPFTYNVTPPSPNAASLGKYGDYEVDQYTGAPSINIPLLSVKSRDIAVPISLSYHGTGIKVDEIASWVGLGWSLNAGGLITRAIHGLPDESPNGYFNTYFNYPTAIYSSVETQYWTFFTQASSGLIDTEPDEYFYNVGGSAGKFYIDHNRICHPVPFKNIKIEFGTFNSLQDVFKITMEDGTTYLFTEKELTGSAGCHNEMAGTMNATTWHVTSITSPTHISNIQFQYNAYTTYVQSAKSTTERTGNDINSPCLSFYGIPQIESCNLTETHYAKSLSKIIYNDGYIDFIQQSTTRTDLAGDKALDRIRHYTSSGTLLSSWVFDYNYVSNRLMLNKVTEYSQNGNAKPPYLFTYNSNLLPPRLSYSQDHWGYYNGYNNPSMLPTVNWGTPGFISPKGANRDVNPNKVSAQILEKIVYPTGGYTSFEFENNTYGYAENNAGILDTFRITIPKTKHCHSVTNSGDPSDSDTDTLIFNINYPQPIYITTSKAIDSPSNGSSANFQLFPTSAVSQSALQSGYCVTLTPVGSYTLKTDVYRDQSPHVQSDITVSYRLQTGYSLQKFRYGPGLRIKSIKTNDGVTAVDEVTNYKYHLNAESDRSSGHLLSAPNYFSSMGITQTVSVASGQAGGTSNIVCGFNVRHSASQGELGSSHGSSVIYTEVTQEKVISNQANGKTICQFSFNGAYGSKSFPFMPIIARDYKNGLLLKKEIYDINNALIAQTSNIFTTDATNNKINVLGYKVGRRIFGNSNSLFTTMALSPSYTFIWVPYYYVSEWNYLTKSAERIFNPNNPAEVHEKITEYYYDNPVHGFVSRQKTTLSNNDVVTQYKKYPQDYNVDFSSFPASSNSAETAGLKGLLNKHIYNPTIEEYITNNNGNGERITGAALKIYNDNLSSGYTNLTQVRKFVPSSSSPVINYSGTGLNANGVFTYDSRYQSDIVINNYDAGNAPSQITSRENKYAYINESGNGNQLAKAIGADFNDIAFTSFETSEGNWNYSQNMLSTSSSALTGNKYYILLNSNSPVSNSIPLNTGKTYKVIFWAMNGGTPLLYAGTNLVNLTSGPSRKGWTYYEGTFSGSASVQIKGSGICNIDELRLYPVDAFMNTYCYEKGIGMTSECDVNNKIVYYEYDDFQRLSLIRDMDGNILKKLDYQYQEQQN